MPLPHFPSDESDEERAPNINDVVDRILNGGDDPSPTPTGARYRAVLPRHLTGEGFSKG